jgi:hypothetical protein
MSVSGSDARRALDSPWVSLGILMLSKPILGLVPNMQAYDVRHTSAGDLKVLLAELAESDDFEEVIEAHDIYDTGATITTVLAGVGFLPLLFLPKTLAHALLPVVYVVGFVSASVMVASTIQSHALKRLRSASAPKSLRPRLGVDLVSSVAGIAVAVVMWRFG